MVSPLHVEYPGAVYHVMNCGLARQPTSRAPTDYETFLQVLRATHSLRLQKADGTGEGKN